MTETKKCSSCMKIKKLERFSTDKRNSSGRTSQCRVCCRMWARKRPKRKTPKPTTGEKRCPRCDETLGVSEFYAKGDSKTGLMSHCKECHNATVDGYRLGWKSDD